MAGFVVWTRVDVLGPDGTRQTRLLLTGEGNPDLAVVDWLARLQRTARRAGGRIRLEEACPALVDLLDLVGLRREVGGQAEGGKEAFGVEEGVDRRDATP